MLRSLPFLCQRVYNTPLAIHPMRGASIARTIAAKLGVTNVVFDGGAAAFGSTDWDYEPEPEAEGSGYQVVDGVALIPVWGTLVKGLGRLQPTCGMTGYDSIRSNLISASRDRSVRALLFDFESQGGEIAGCLDLVDAIYFSRGRKPMWAVLSETAHASAYALASATDRILVPRTGSAGSVGVICIYAEFSKMLAAQGLTVTMIHYGARKADGNQYTPMEEKARRRFQADVDSVGTLFAKTVARNRGLSFAAVRDMQGATYMGRRGVDVGLVDAVMAPDQAMAELLAKVNSDRNMARSR
jgi:ClpP class serine protease